MVLAAVFAAALGLSFMMFFSPLELCVPARGAVRFCESEARSYTRRAGRAIKPRQLLTSGCGGRTQEHRQTHEGATGRWMTLPHHRP